jgi:hypothetical protein
VRGCRRGLNLLSPISFIIWEKRGDVKRRKLKKNIVISENEP